jgi:hypothetical protein
MGWMAGVRFPAEAEIFFLFYNVQTGSGVHPSSYSMDIGGAFSDSKVAGALN